MIYILIYISLILISENKNNVNKNNINNILNNNEIKNYNSFRKKYILINEFESQINEMYKGIYKNHPKEKYFKMFKRLKTLISLLKYKFKDNLIYKNILKEINNELINKLKLQETNNIKNRVNSLLLLKDKVTKTII